MEQIDSALEGSRLRVLLVDDEEDHYVWTRRVLCSRSDAWIDWARTYDDALPAIRDRRHDVILVDYRLHDEKGRDGLDLVRHTRQQRPCPPCVMLSVLPYENLGADSLSAGAAGYLTKSEMSPSLLLRVIRHALERGRAEQELFEKNRALELLLHATARTNEAPSIRDAFESCLSEVFVELGWEASDALVVTASGGLVPLAAHSSMDGPAAAIRDVLALTPDAGAKPLSLVVQTREHAFFGDLSRARDARYQALSHLGMHVALLLPIVAHGELVGILELYSASRHRPEQWWLDVLTSTTTQLGQVALRERAEIDRKRAEEDLQRSQRLDTLGRLAGGVAHDFNNLLTVITATAELLLRKEPGRRDDTPLETMRDAAMRGAQLTRQLLSLGKKDLVEPRVVEVNRLIQSTESLLRRTLRENIELRFDLAPDVGCIEVDPTAFEQVLLNLVINAKDAIEGAGSLTIETRLAVPSPGGSSSAPCVRVSVSDTGVGMSADTLKHVFDPFFTTKGPHRGTGLGLSSALGIVRHAGGSIDVESEIGTGTSFHLYFPLQAGGPSPCPSEPPPAAECGGDETVLLVEDDDHVRSAAALALRSYGYAVLSAASPGQALAIARRTEVIDLVLSDVVMPNQSGVQLVDELAKIHPGTPALFMTGHTPAMAEHAGAVDLGRRLVRKPFTPAELVARVRKTLNRAKHAR